MRLRRRHSLSKLNCLSVRYGLAVSLDKFDLATFKKKIAMTDSSKQVADSFANIAPTRDFSRTDYHVHFLYHWTGHDFHATIEYYRGAEKPRRGDRGPFAEEIVAWLGQFVKNDRATAQVNAAFAYSAKKWT